MNSDQNKLRRWRPRWSVRGLLFVVTLSCAYLACWKPTSGRGVRDVMRTRYFEIYGRRWDEQSAGLFGRADMAELFYFEEPAAILPLVVTTLESGRKVYRFWFFGFVSKLPWEWTTLSLAEQIEAEGYLLDD